MKHGWFFGGLILVGVLAVLLSGCIAHPGSTVVIQVGGWRSAFGTGTNVVNSSAGGGELALPIK